MSTDEAVSLRIPSQGPGDLGSDLFSEVVAYTDASHAGSTRNRRGVSGGVLTYFQGVVKTYSRHQTSISLTSCESELQAIQVVVQETSRNYSSGSVDHSSHESSWMVYSDSEPALKILRAMDLPRRPRHIDAKFEHGSLNVPIEHHPTIRYMVYNGYYKVMSNILKMGQLPTPVEWIRELISNGFAEIKYLKGVDLVADALTKCLSSARLYELQDIMGFCERRIFKALMSLVPPKKHKGFALLEVCLSITGNALERDHIWG